jgi:FKBP-type peptidyl-prolyl cis-trans isomerase 2
MTTNGSFGIDLRPANPFKKTATLTPNDCCNQEHNLKAKGINKTLKIEKDRVVYLKYIIKSDDGEIMEDHTSIDPVAYVHGSGSMLTSLEAELVGLTAGDDKSFVLTDEQFTGTLHFDVFINNVRAATQDEISTGKPIQEIGSTTKQRCC